MCARSKVLAAIASLALIPALAASASAATMPGSDKSTVPVCRERQLDVGLTREEGVAGSTYKTIRFIHDGRRCAVQGAPRVVFLDRNHDRVGFKAERVGGRGDVVILRKSDRVKTAVRYSNPGLFDEADCKSHRTRYLRVKPPHTKIARSYSYRTEICTTKNVGPDVRPVT